MEEKDALKSGVSLECNASPLSSGVSLERETDAPSAAPGGQSAKARLEAMERGGVTNTEDVEMLRALAADESIPRQARFRAHRLCARYAVDHKDWLRGVFHGEEALTLAGTEGQKAICYELIFLARKGLTNGTLTPESMECYEHFAQTAAKSALAGERCGIELLQGGTAEVMKDYALLALAYKAWSVHPGNEDDFEREEAEATYHRHARAFEEQLRQGCREMIYRSNDRAPEKWRIELLKGQIHVDDVGGEDETTQMDRKPAGPTLSGVPGEIQQFVEQHDMCSAQRASDGYVRDYINMARKVVNALRGGDKETMRYVVGNYQIFEGMQDYIILCSAALLWAMHPENTNAGERLQVQKRSEEWTERCMELMDPDDRYPLYQRLRQTRDIPAAGVQALWGDLLNYVLQALREYNA